MSWISEDITWCYNECDDMKCFRNVKHLDGREGYFSMSMLKGTEYCPSYDGDDECCQESRTDELS